MSAKRTCARFPAALAAMFLLGSGACSDRASDKPQASDAAGKGQVPPVRAGDGLPRDEAGWQELMSHRNPLVGEPFSEIGGFVPGETDRQNRYRATVLVRTHLPSATPSERTCSGVLVGTRLVLTAGSCVCSGRKQPALGGGEQTLIDATSCAKTGAVTTTSYEPPTATESGLRAMIDTIAGEIRPHPALKVVLDEQGNIVSSEADLAVIEVETDGPLLDSFPPVEMAETELRTNESLLMVSYGNGETVKAIEVRRFGRHHVTKLLDGGARALFDQPMRKFYMGHSGAPMMRETGQGVGLAGIVSRGLGTEASFTSIFHYRDWIRQEIHRAASASPSPR